MGDDAIDKADTQSLVRPDAASREDEIEGPSLTDHARKADRAKVDQGHAEPAIEDTQPRIVRRDAKVAPQRELEAAGDGESLDRGYDRLAERHPRRAHRTIARFIEAACLAGGQRLQVIPGTEGPAGACQYGDRQGIVRVEAAECRRQRGRRLRIDGVADLRPVDGDGDDRPLNVITNGQRAPFSLSSSMYG